MFGPITIPFGARMLFNEVRLKPGVSIDDVELALAEMCYVVKVFEDKFAALARMCTDTRELGYEMLWQGVPEH